MLLLILLFVAACLEAVHLQVVSGGPRNYVTLFKSFFSQLSESNESSVDQTILPCIRSIHNSALLNEQYAREWPIGVLAPNKYVQNVQNVQDVFDLLLETSRTNCYCASRNAFVCVFSSSTAVCSTSFN